MGERSAKQIAQPWKSAPDGGGGPASILGGLIFLAARAVELKGGPKANIQALSEARVGNLRQWLELSLEEQAADLRTYLCETRQRLAEILAAGTLRGLVPPCAMEAERLWFELNLEVLIAMVRGVEGLGEKPDESILQAVRVAYEYAGGFPNVKAFSAKIGRSADHLSRRFREYTGMGFGRYLQLLRMRVAFEMLRNPRVAIGEIAASLGYGTRGNFIRAFQSGSGMSPGEFRRQIRSV
jgi:AraC-like DNA-binding protein